MSLNKESLKTLLLQNGPLPEGAAIDKIVSLAENLQKLSSESAVSFLNASSSVFPCLFKEEITDSELVGSGRILWVADPIKSHDSAKKTRGSDPQVLDREWFAQFKNWFEQGKHLTLRYPDAGVKYFQATPAFLEKEKIFRTKQWADWSIKILDSGSRRESASADYFSWSIALLEFMPFRELLEWNKLGLMIAGRSAEGASSFFSSIPKGLRALYRSERIEVLKLSLLIAESFPEMAVAFFQTCPERLLGVSPTVRKQILQTVQHGSHVRSKQIIKDFDAVITAVTGLSFPAQERVVANGALLKEISAEALSGYYDNMRNLLEKIPDGFLSIWVKSGLAYFPEDHAGGVAYFRLQTPHARNEMLKWKEAVLLDDHRRIISLFVRGLTGKDLKLKSTEEIEDGQASVARYYPTCDGETIYLPPFIEKGKNRKENFLHYKVAAAHQAGYVEFGTFDFGLYTILPILESMPLKDLAKDIFYILEDGRIDRRLRMEYPGLRQDMDRVLSAAMLLRPDPGELPLREALIEVLLRLTLEKAINGVNGQPQSGWLEFEHASALVVAIETGRSIPALKQPITVHTDISRHILFLQDRLSGFYENAQTVWDCFHKSLEIYNYLARLPGGNDYRSFFPLHFRGRLDSDLIVANGPIALESCEGENGDKDNVATPDQINPIIDQLKDGSDLIFREIKNLEVKGSFLTDLDGVDVDDASNDSNNDGSEGWKVPFIFSGPRSIAQDASFYYDEWDYRQQNYRRRWCRIQEKQVSPLDIEKIDEIYSHYHSLIQSVRKQFQQIRPSFQEIVRRVEWGDEIDMPALIQHVVDRKTGAHPSENVFLRKERRIRRISTALLVDMSASTEKRVPLSEESIARFKGNALDDAPPSYMKPYMEKKIIDIEIESLVVIMEALDALNDDYAIFGFSGSGRENVDFYLIKDFCDPYSDILKRRISGIRPKESTRMGTAIRHAVDKLKDLDADQRLLIILSDGYPQDHDYGEDRSSEEYGLHDTMMAMLEAKREGIRPFCLTVDQSGNDYLRKMCDPANYLVIQDAYSLPEVLPKVVESLMV